MSRGKNEKIVGGWEKRRTTKIRGCCLDDIIMALEIYLASFSISKRIFSLNLEDQENKKRGDRTTTKKMFKIPI